MTAETLLTQWVKLKYEGHRIKRSGEPYFKHLLAVAELAAPVTCMGYETGLCHDLLEDTTTIQHELSEALTGFGYAVSDASYIAACVVELTDVFTRLAYPAFSKKARKEREALRLTGISPAAQTIKYCDLIDNIKWVMEYDQRHALKYLLKKRLLINVMTRGDKGIREEINKGLAVVNGFAE